MLREAKANPVAALMAGAGIAWLLLSASKRAADGPDPYRLASDPYDADRPMYRNPVVAPASPAARRTDASADVDPVRPSFPSTEANSRIGRTGVEPTVAKPAVKSGGTKV